MGNEGSKPVVEEGATRFNGAAHDATPPPGTGRYAADAEVKAEPGGSSPPGSSLNVGVPDNPGASQFYNGRLAPSSPDFKRAFPASNPEFPHELPTLSSPNRVRPPSPPPATEPAAFHMPVIVDGLPRLPTSSPNERRSKGSGKKRHSLTAPSQNLDIEPTSPAAAPSTAPVEADTPQSLTKAQRKELKRQRRLARKSGASLADSSVLSNDAGDALPEPSQAPVPESEEVKLNTTPTTVLSSSKKNSHRKHTINGLSSTQTESQPTEPSHQHEEVTNGMEVARDMLRGDDAAVEPLLNGSRDLPLNGGDESGALRKRKQTPEPSPKSTRKQKKVRVVHTSGSDGDSSEAHPQLPQASDQDMLDAPTESPSTMKNRKRRTEQRSADLQDPKDVAIASNSPGGDSGLRVSPPAPSESGSQLGAQEEAADESVIGSLGTFRSINADKATPKRTPAAAQITYEAEVAGENGLMSTPREQSSRKRNRKAADQERLAATTEAEAPASAEASQKTNAPDLESLGRDEATEGPGSQHEDQLAEPAQSERRSTRKRRSKPSYFEREDQENKRALEALPQEEALTPTKKPSKKARGAPGSAARPEKSERSQKKERKSKGDYAQGMFSVQENEALKQAVEEFRVDQGLSQREINSIIHENPAGSESKEVHKALWEKVTAACPQRRRQKIIIRARAMFHNFVGRGIFTPEQDQELRDLVGRMGEKWTEIGKIVDRNPLDLRDRWRNYVVCGEQKKATPWEEDEVSRLLELVLEAIDTILKSRGQDFSEEAIEQAGKDVAWDLISQQMDRTRSAKQCREKWQLIQARRNEDGSGDEDDAINRALQKTREDLRRMTPEDKHALIKAIRATNVGKDDKIPWAKLGNAAFRKRWYRDTLRIMWSRLRQTVDGHELLTTRNVAQALLDSYDRDRVLAQLDDDQVDNKAEATILGIISAKKKSRTPRKSAVNGEMPSKATKRKRADTEEDEEEKLTSAGEGSSSRSPARRAKTSKRVRSGEGTAAARRLSAQVTGAPGNQRKRPGSLARVHLSAEFVDNSDNFDDEDERAPSPEVPASPEPPRRSTPEERATVQTPQSGGGRIINGDLHADDDVNNDESEEDNDVQAETESVDLSMQPELADRASRSADAADMSDDSVEAEEADKDSDADVTIPSSLKPRPSQTFSPAFAHGRFKKQRASMQTYSAKKTPRTPFSASRKAFADVYDDIEEAHGESSQLGPDSATKGRGREQDDSAQRDSTADKAANGPKLAVLENDSDSDSDMEDIPATLPTLSQQSNTHATDHNEAESHRLAEESESDSDMEEIPARLPDASEDEEDEEDEA